MTMDNSSTVQIGMNGYKLVKDGVVAPSITEKEEQQLKRIEKASAKQKKAEDKAELKALKNSYKAKIKEMNAEFKESQKDYALREKIQSSTSGNEAIEKYERTKMSRTPSGYMTVEEYEELSAPKDRMTMEVEIPKIPTPADMIYVPQPNYKIARYNNPPGSPEITITNTLYKRWQQNAQGIVSPDFKRLVYPSVYYYPNSGSTACDLFVINLEEAKSNMDRILTANTVHRLSEPILSTEKTNDNYFTFRTLTPVDFTPDGTKLLVKEKIGNTRDGIWKTTPIVYDFSVGNSYSLADV